MEVRLMTAGDLERVRDIDSTSESGQYLHVERSGKGLNSGWKIEPRPLREKRTHRRALDDEQAFAMRQIVTGADEGVALVGEHEDALVASAVSTPDPVNRVAQLIDLRVDFDFRRQGLASVMLFRIIQDAREHELRAVSTAVAADNFPALQMLEKFGFEPAGLDTHHASNHDLVKETVLIFWYLTLD